MSNARCTFLISRQCHRSALFGSTSDSNRYNAGVNVVGDRNRGGRTCKGNEGGNESGVEMSGRAGIARKRDKSSGGREVMVSFSGGGKWSRSATFRTGGGVGGGEEGAVGEVERE
jgi:hypothetical protein